MHTCICNNAEQRLAGLDNELDSAQVLPRLEQGSLSHQWVKARVGKLVFQGSAVPFCQKDKS